MIYVFIIGMLFAAVVYPVLSSAISVVIAWLDVKQAQASAEIAKIQQELQLSGIEQVDPQPIGFRLEEFDEQEDFEEDE